jgi:hypothetical protein
MSCNGCGDVITMRTREGHPFANTNLQGHPHTVQTSHVPLYLRGLRGLGDDSTGVPDYETAPVYTSDIPDQIPLEPTIPSDTAAPFGFSLPDPTNTGGGVPSFANAGQPVTQSLTQAIANFFKPSTPASTQLAPGASPRVGACPAGYGMNAAGQCVPAAGSLSLGSALPLIGLGVVALVIFSGRRRR